MRIFVGSSGESKETMLSIAGWIAEFGHEPVPWNGIGVFPLGQHTFQNLQNLTKQVDAAVFVFAEDDRMWYRDDAVTQPRDNVLLEYGLFVGALGPKRAVIYRIGDPTIASNLKGITYIQVENTQRAESARAKFELREWLLSLAKEGIDKPQKTELWYYPRSSHERFKAFLLERLPIASKVLMIGSGLNVLAEPAFAEQLIGRAAEHECEIEIYMANPYSPAVEVRLIEEELGVIKPPDGKPGLKQRMEMLLTLWRQAGRPESIKIRMFTHYPTFALIIVDDDYFVYPYSYCTLGNFSPVIRFSRETKDHDDMIHFLNQHYERVRRDSIEAEQLMITPRTRFGADVLHSFAVFFVPAENSSLYRFGSDVLGYDIHTKRPYPSPEQDFVGNAATYGFHLTICDALYFLTEAEIRKVTAEVEYLAKDFTPFQLSNLRIDREFPNDSTLTIIAEDPSGRLEAIHHELVQRVYRRATASNYSLNRSLPDRGKNDDRCKFMMERYTAPYILNQFHPHFTLLSGITPGAKEEAYNRLSKAFNAQVTDREIQVERLAIMSKNPESEQWSIEKVIPLASQNW